MNGTGRDRRLAELRGRMEEYRQGTRTLPEPAEYVNNHIHTTYSFSPYSPSEAVLRAWESGLSTAGIMDHDSMAGADEFIAAGETVGIATTVGFECRCSMSGTPLEGRRINNPDQKSVGYVALHGVSHKSIERAQQWLTPYREKRNLRNRAMAERLGGLLADIDPLDFDRDIVPLSEMASGGTITERHILFALANRLMEQVGRGRPLTGYLRGRLSVQVSTEGENRLLDTGNPMYAYYLLGILKSGLVERFYIDADDELPHVTEFLRLARETGGIPAYAYLGDVSGSVTGDKKDQAFEDAYLDELVQWTARSGFQALTYMPMRNTMRQLQRVMALCDANGLFQISGEDINSPFQSFQCPALKRPEFRHLVENTWALIGHEHAVTEDAGQGMFAPETVLRFPDLGERIGHFARIGRGLQHPGEWKG